MELTPELIGTGFVGLLIIAGAVGNYLRSLRTGPPRTDAVVAGIGIGLIEREQAERLLAIQTRQAEAMERIAGGLGVIADRERADMKDTLETLVEQLRPKQPAQRRRKT